MAIGRQVQAILISNQSGVNAEPILGSFHDVQIRPQRHPELRLQNSGESHYNALGSRKPDIIGSGDLNALLLAP